MSRGVKRDNAQFEQQHTKDGDRGEDDRKRSKFELSAPHTVQRTPSTSGILPSPARMNGNPESYVLSDIGDVSPYDLATEERPRLAVYCDSFSKAENGVGRIIQKFIRTHENLRAKKYHDQAISRVCDTLAELAVLSHHYKAMGPVACLGAAGVAKSSTVNSIMSKKMLAIEHGGHERGTYVVHEYLGPHPAQKTPYYVLVLFHSEQTVKSLVRRHCGILLQKSEDSDDGEEQEEADELGQKQGTAVDFFHTVMRDRAEFQTLDKTKAFFNNVNDDQAEDLTNDLVEHAIGFIRARGLHDNQKVYECVDEKDLNEKFREVSKPALARRNTVKPPSPWPLVAKIQVHQYIDLLRTGLALADTPGVSDSNLTVVENTTNYLSDAETILVFASIERIAQNELLDQQLKYCINLGKMQSTILVVTKIDLKQAYSEDESQDLEEADLNLYRAAEDKLARAQSKSRRLEISKQAATDNDQYRELDGQLRSCNQEIVKAQGNLREVVAEIQCREVGTVMKEKFRQLTKSKTAPALRVHFVSNTQYQLHVAGYNIANPPVLDVETTGVPRLRHALYTIAARGKFATLKMIVKHRIIQSMKGIQGILTKSSLERKEELRNEIKHQLHLFDALAPAIVKKVLRFFEDGIRSTVKNNLKIWCAEGVKLAKRWEKMKPATFAAFCRKGGFHKPPKTKDIVSWNSLICDIFQSQLAEACDTLLDEVDKEIALWPDKVSGTFRKFKMKITTSPSAQGMDLAEFFTVVDNVQEELMGDLCIHGDRLHSMIQNVNSAMTTDGKDNYVAEAMRNTECLSATKPPFDKNRPHKKRVEAISKKLSGEGEESVFFTMSKKARQNLLKRLKHWEKGVQEAVGEGCKTIKDDFAGRFQTAEEAEQASKDDKHKKEVDCLQQAVGEALNAINTEVMGYIKECEAYEESSA
ncbi:unnamed protein product [Cercospora beticola]|nr:unnamed protein product [Cercospora beticola]